MGYESSPPDLAELLRRLRNDLPRLQKDYAVRSLGVFGSYRRGEQRRDSDLDLLVEFERTPGLLRFLELETSLSERLGVKVDLVQKEALKPAIGARILQEVLPV